MKEGKQGERAVKYNVVNLLRTEEAPDNVAIKWVLRLSEWQGVGVSGCQDPPPTLLEFASPRHRERFLASAD